MSALTVVIYVQALIMLAFMGFTSAVEPVFSYHYGSGNGRMIKRVYRLPSGMNAADVQQTLAPMLDGIMRLKLDMLDLNYISSAGLRVLFCIPVQGNLCKLFVLALYFLFTSALQRVKILYSYAGNGIFRTGD